MQTIDLMGIIAENLGLGGRFRLKFPVLSLLPGNAPTETGSTELRRQPRIPGIWDFAMTGAEARIPWAFPGRRLETDGTGSDTAVLCAPSPMPIFRGHTSCADREVV